MKGIRGITILELMAVLAIAAILAFVAIPTALNYIQTNRLNNTAQQLYFNLQYARSAAIQNNSTVFFSFQTGNNWCYGVKKGSACTCSSPSACDLGSVAATTTQTLALSSSGISGTSIQFEPVHGAANTSGIVTFKLIGQSIDLSVQIGRMGNLTLCSSTMPGYSACT